MEAFFKVRAIYLPLVDFSMKDEGGVPQCLAWSTMKIPICHCERLLFKQPARSSSDVIHDYIVWMFGLLK